MSSCTSSPSGPDGPDDQDVPTVCGASNTVELAVGQATEMTGTGARFFCARAGDEAAEFVLVAFAAATTSLEFTVESSNTLQAQGPPFPAPEARAAERPSVADALSAAPVRDVAFEAALRAREWRELTPLVTRSEVTARATVLDAPAAVVPSVGDFLTFNAQSNSSCSDPIFVTGRVAAISQKAIVVADTANPSGGFSTADYQHYAATFDTLIAPIALQNFGDVTDIDANDRTILLFTQEVNRRTASGSQTFTAGFFFSRDLFPKQTPLGGNLQACLHSNQAEMLYLMVPDPNGEVNGNTRSKSFVQQLMLSAIIHESQHLINAGRRLYVQMLGGATWNEEVWLNEGLSHAAEELLFYRASGLAPGGNLSPTALQAAGPSAVTAFNRHQANNLLRFHDHLATPPNSSPFNTVDNLATRGASWSFLRYAADRRGGSQSAFFFPLVNSSTRGLDNLEEVLGGETTVYQWLSDWAVAAYADDRVAGSEARHTDRSWNHPAMHATLSQAGAPYPIQTRALVAGSPRTQQLVRGGAAYFRFSVAAGEAGEVEATSNGTTPPATLRVTLLRTR
jgi:hypothetical protein